MTLPPVYTTLLAYVSNATAMPTRYVPDAMTAVVTSVDVFVRTDWPLETWVVYDTLLSTVFFACPLTTNNAWFHWEGRQAIGELAGLAAGSLLGLGHADCRITGYLLQGNMPGPLPT